MSYGMEETEWVVVSELEIAKKGFEIIFVYGISSSTPSFINTLSLALKESFNLFLLTSLVCKCVKYTMRFSL